MHREVRINCGVMVLVWTMLAIAVSGGCSAPSRKQWQMVFTTTDGKVVLTQISTGSLFMGMSPNVVTTFETSAPCQGAWYDPASGRLATAEKEGATQVVRVYDSEGDLLAQYPLDPRVIGKVCHNPCLSNGGRRVAFLGNLGSVFWAKVDEDSTGEVYSLWKLRGAGPLGSMLARFGSSNSARCYWVGEGSLAATCNPPPGKDRIYRVNVDDSRGHPIADGHLAGVIEGERIVAGTYWTPFRLSDAESGTRIGTAYAGHGYCHFERISPCGEYVFYHETPGLLVRHKRLFVHHLKSGRRAALAVPSSWKLGSWHEVGISESPALSTNTPKESELPAADKSSTSSPPLFFSTPSASARIQYLTCMTGADQVEARGTSIERRAPRGDAAVPRMITYVAGVAARDGVLYVCDSLGGCVWRLDYRHGTYSLFGLDGPGRLQLPTDIILTDNASKYVVDAHRKQIVVFGPEDEYTNTFDLPEACNPRDVAAYGQEFYVLCGGEERRIDVLDISSGQLLRTIGERNIASEQFVGACSLCIDSKGFLYVSDGGNQCVQKLTRDGQLVWVKELHGHYEWFRNPVDVRAAPDDAVYWIGAGRPSKIHRYSADGQVHMAFGGPTTVPNPLFGLRVLAIDATSLPYFRDYMHEGFNAEYLLFVADTHDHSVVNIYAFGSFAEGDQRLQ